MAKCHAVCCCCAGVGLHTFLWGLLLCPRPCNKSGLWHANQNLEQGTTMYQPHSPNGQVSLGYWLAHFLSKLTWQTLLGPVLATSWWQTARWGTPCILEPGKQLTCGSLSCSFVWLWWLCLVSWDSMVVVVVLELVCQWFFVVVMFVCISGPCICYFLLL